jgi:hypothetical protein
MCKNIDIVRLDTPEEIIPAYTKALNSNRTTILVENPDFGK